MAKEIVIESRYNGPPESGNGGYTAGMVAAALGAERAGAVVTLRRPPPLDTPMRLAGGTDAAEVYAGEQLVAEAHPSALDSEPVPWVPLGEAVAASAAYPGFTDHPFPTCFVCGPDRDLDDGLRIFPGPRQDGLTAAPWRVPAEVSAVTVWSALDCPGGWAIISPGRPYVLGRMAARVDSLPSPSTSCVVTGVVRKVVGRKAEVSTALHGPGGELLARADSTWIAVEQTAASES